MRESESVTVRVRVRVSGRVQGVWFRGWTQARALDLGVVGFARNLADGSVEIVAQGPRHAVDALLDLCRKGPPSARVDQTVFDEESAGDEHTGFRVL
jgi:acylphosphatase